MKIRTLEELIEAIDADFAWRRKELSLLNSNIKSAKFATVNTALRIGIVMLYAHWEGFVKNISEAYLNYVSLRGLRYDELNHCFIAIALKEKLSSCENSNKSTIHTQTIAFLLENMSKTAAIPKKDIIKTQSNLSSDILKEILTTIGIDFTPYELKSNLIDSKLLKFRNTIAHGQYLSLDPIEFEDIYKGITFIMTDLKDKISNAAILSLYKKGHEHM